MAAFPDGVNRPVQYGQQLKAHAVYLSQYPLLPYSRIEEYFADQLNIPISVGSLFNFNQEAAELIAALGAEDYIKAQLCAAPVIHVDETGVNVGGKRHWLHCASNARWTCLFPHQKRGVEAMDAMGILPGYRGIACHDHWKPYYQYNDCAHALCNAHHLRELEYAWDKDGQQWAKVMQAFLLKLNEKVKDAGGQLPTQKERYYRKKYRDILDDAEKECPPPDKSQRKAGQRGRIKRSKSRNLLERLREFEDDILRFMVIDFVPFTNNRGENDIRMTKVQQKISGCFRSPEGAVIFSRIRGYVSSCRKQGLTATHALTSLFQSTLPGIFSECAE
ncbi:IS66 family transposase [Exilibacterium tricleocarpae]|uniref:IS66 family transposase n=1 Tax=Exilibacterium tricleocarpae TaxID=2591008 RepID=A0A545U5R9_9GAMM|nr:IS66 family transposase [Exilibacterium tricleocarpae]